MKNPLNKRLPRELKQDVGKYIAIFIFLVITIGFISGFLVAGTSLKSAYDESFEKYNVEDGHFIIENPLDNSQIKALEDENDIEIYENLYCEKNSVNDSVIRIYKIRERVNIADVLEGDLPKNSNEIAIDRLYAKSNNLKIGEGLKVGDKTYQISGIVALTDYSALFKNNSDMMFDTKNFCVALVNEDCFNEFDISQIFHKYSWTNNNKNLSDDDKNEKSDEILKSLVTSTIITDFVSQENNQAINFAGEDMGKDEPMMIALLCIIMVVLAFVIAVTTGNKVEQESKVIGTLRASGYTKSEVVRNYMSLPIVIIILSAIVGNILGYTVFKYLWASLYYESYSLTSYTLMWNAKAFLITTVCPTIIMLAVNLLVLYNKLSLSPLRFLRRDLKKSKNNRAVKLPSWKFLSRFRMRVIVQNLPVYVNLFIGIFVANVLLMFGLMMSPLLKNYKAEIQNSAVSKYQYVLKAPAETDNKSAEKYCVAELEIKDTVDEVMVYGFQNNSDYVKNITMPKNSDEIVISNGYMEKYRISVGDKIILRDNLKDEDYEFTVVDSYNYPANLAVFLSADNFNKIFGKDDNYYSGYLSSDKLPDIDEKFVATIITEQDLAALSEQLDTSFGEMFVLLGAFSSVLFVLIIYLLAKIVLEKNSNSISMVKILGYNNREISSLYITSTAIVVVVSILLSLPLAKLCINAIYSIMMQDMKGWMTMYLAPSVYISTIVIGVLCYGFVSIIQYKKIKKIPMDKVLKNAE